MLVALTLVGPCLAAQLATGWTPLFEVGTSAKRALAVAVALYVLGASVEATSRMLVPLSFAVGVASLAIILHGSGASRRTVTLAVAGAVANLIPMIVHGAMPVVQASRLMVSQNPAAESRLLAAKHVEVDSISTPLAALSDWIPLPGISVVMSVGDVLLLVGLGLLVVDRRRPSAERL